MHEMYTKAREFAVKHIDPWAKIIDEEQRFPVETFEALGNEGWLKLLIPREYGGDGLTMVEFADACRGFAQSSCSVGLCFMMHNVATMCVIANGNEELKKQVFADVVNNHKFLALAYSEFGTGTHFYIPEVSAVVEGDHVTINGTKSMVTSARHASYYLVLTPSDVEGAIDNWVVPIDAPGLSFVPGAWDGLGMRGNVSCPMKMDNVELPLMNRIGAAGSGMEQVFGVVAPFFITGLAAVYTGLSQDVLAEALNRAHNRTYPFGTGLKDIETIQLHISNIYASTNAAIEGTNEAARAAVAGEEDALAKILSARIFASEAAIENATIGMRIVGGKGYNGASSMERLLRDSFAGQIMAPSVDVLHVWLGKALLGLPLP